MKIRETSKPTPNLSGKLTLTVGIHGAEGGAQHSDPLQGGSFSEDGAIEGASGPPLTVAEIASFHEFGRGVPQRSFVRGWFDEVTKSGEMGELLRTQLRAAVDGKRSLDEALERVALKAQASMQKRIRNRGNGNYPPLAASTIAKKGSSVPLIDTGQLRASIRAKVERS